MDGSKFHHQQALEMLYTDSKCNRFYIIGVVWNVLVAVVIYFTYVETKGLTLEQIDKRLHGEPVDVDVIEAYDGGKPIAEGELGKPTEATSKVDVKS